MSGFEIQKTGELLNTKPTQLSTHESSNSAINISFKNNDKLENTIKMMVKLVYPDVNWEQLSETEKQNYYTQYENGTLQQKCQEITEPEAKEIRKAIKNMAPSEAVNYLVTIGLEKSNPKFSTFTPEEKQKLAQKESLKLLQEIDPQLDVSKLNDKQKEAMLKTYEFKLETACWAFKEGKIDKLVDLKNYTPQELKDLEYEYSKTLREKNLDNYNDNYAARRAYAQGTFERNVAKNAGLELEELRSSSNKLKFSYDYLTQKPADELTIYEKRQLETLKQLTKVFGENFENMNIYSEQSVTNSILYKYANGEEVDWNDPAKNNVLLQKLESDINECKTPEDKQSKMAAMLKSASSADEALILASALARLEKKGTISANQMYKAYGDSGHSAHCAVACSHEMSAEGQKCTAEHVAHNATCEHATYSAEQAANYTKNMIPQYQTDAQAHSMNAMTDTGINEVINVTGETLAKLDQEAAKQSYEYAMKSENISAEQKAFIAKDTIDNIEDANLKKFYQELASKYEIDYNSVPPKAERIAKKEGEKSETGESKVAQTEYSGDEISEILAKANRSDKNILQVLGQGIRETVDIILGKTPDNDISGEKIKQITTLNAAISELKAGTKLSDVFRGSNETTKKELVEIICTYGKTAIGQLIDAFGGDTVYKLAKTANSKALIKKEIQRIALSDSTQRMALAQIEKAEQKKGFSAKI